MKLKGFAITARNKWRDVLYGEVVARGSIGVDDSGQISINGNQLNVAYGTFAEYRRRGYTQFMISTVPAELPKMSYSKKRLDTFTFYNLGGGLYEVRKLDAKDAF